MSLIIKKLSLRNFLSIGNVPQDIDFDTTDLTLILGENLDLGGNDAGSRNGVGKTTMLQGLSYALYGSAINTIKKDNLINRTNEKNMSVTLEFSSRGVDYKIVRGRKPNILKFFVNDAEQVSLEDDSQGENRQTQEAIERVLCMSQTMFQHIVGLNSYTTPFLSMKVSDQRVVIEQLLGITLLSEKAEAIKELNKQVKDEIKQEEFRIAGINESNKRIQDQIDSLKRRQTAWKEKYDSDVELLISEYTKLSQFDIDGELKAHRDLAEYNERSKKKEFFDNLISKQKIWKQKQSADLETLKNQLISIGSVDIEAELAAHAKLAEWNQRSKDIKNLESLISRCLADEAKEMKMIEKLKAEIADLEAHKCYACGQDFHDSNHEGVLKSKRDMLQEVALQALATNGQWIENTDALKSLGELGPKPTTHYSTEAEAIRHSSLVDSIISKFDSKNEETDPYIEQLADYEEIVLGTKPITHYKTETEAIQHLGLIKSLETQLSRKNEETDPYADQISEMEQHGLVTVDYTIIDSLNKVLKHQDYLLDLLTNKKSFVRKKIIDQNLSYLNARLSHYLDAIGLPHKVVFQNDLSVEITDMGRDADFDSFSRGERNRVILSLSFAFRDVWETLYNPVNLLFIDELMDSGMDAAGVENGLAILRNFARSRNKSVWLVSHRDELVSRISSILKVVKENGYSSFRIGDE